MKLVICEKPKVAEKIAYALGRGKAVKKHLYEVPYYEVERDGQRLVVVSAVGHLYTLRQKGGGMGYPAFDIEWAPTHEVEREAGYSKKYLDAIEKLSPGAEEYVCACDFDVEGSLIGYNIIRLACGDESRGSRMKFSALTQGELEDAFAERGKLDVKNALAGEARHTLDWFYGINLSRALMGAIRAAGASRGQTMSIGRVQGPALAILAKKEKAIAGFVSQPYWELSCEAKKTRFGNTRGRFGKKEDAQTALAASRSPAAVEKVERKEAQVPPQPPFDLTSLQVEAYRVFNFAPARTLELAQSLYEASMISYPRTSSQKLPAKLNLKRIIEAVSKNPEYAAHAGKLLAQNRLAPLEGKKEDPAHPAIHPTGVVGQAGEKEMRLYDLIVKRFLSCFSESARREQMKVELLSGTENYAASGSRTTCPGWFEIYAPYAKVDEVQLPPFSEGEQVEVADFQIEEKKTQPPKRYTAASIISELERLGLGTKATRAAIVETLFKRGYVEGTSINVTPFGMAVYDLLSSVAGEIMDEELTHKIEEEMELIADGENEQKAIEDGKRVLLGILEKFGGKEREIGTGLMAGLRRKEAGDSLLGRCQKCGGELRSIQSKAGKQFAGCTGYPDCGATFPLPQQAKIVPVGRACEKCGTPVVKVLRKGRNTFEMCLDPACETKRGWGNYGRSAQGAAQKKSAAAAAAKKPASSAGAQPAQAAAQKPAEAAGGSMAQPPAQAPAASQKPASGAPLAGAHAATPAQALAQKQAQGAPQREAQKPLAEALPEPAQSFLQPAAQEPVGRDARKQSQVASRLAAFPKPKRKPAAKKPAKRTGGKK